MRTSPVLRESRKACEYIRQKFKKLRKKIRKYIKIEAVYTHAPRCKIIHEDIGDTLNN